MVSNSCPFAQFDLCVELLSPVPQLVVVVLCLIWTGFFFSFSPFLFSLAVLFCVYGVGFGFLVLLLLDQRIKVGCSWLLSKCEASVFMSRWNVGWFGVDFDGTLDDEMRLD